MSTAFRPASHARRPASSRRSPLYSVATERHPSKPSQSKPSQSKHKQQRPAHSVPQGSRLPLSVVSSPARGAAVVRRFPSARAMPLWLRLLLQIQRGSLVVAFVLVIATLFVYGSTVYTQQLWSKEYRKLKTLTRNEREMIATNEGLKNQLALQAGRPGSGLVPQTPDSTIFLQPAPPRQVISPSPSVPKAEAAPNTPLGY